MKNLRETFTYRANLVKDYSGKNFQKRSFRNKNLNHANFSRSDLRGADFTGANLAAANLTQVRTGITPRDTAFLFGAAVTISGLSGYVAMLTGNLVQQMVDSPDKNIHNAGIISLIGIVLFIGLAVWRGVGNAVRNLIIPATVLAIIIGAVAYGSGVGSGKGMAYIVLSFILIVAMFVIGTTARAMAGSLSGILFWIVALTGGIFGRSVGGGIGTVIMATSCAYISKQAIKGAKGFEGLRSIAFYFTSKFGTSFRKSCLTAADLSNSEIRNADFSGANTAFVNWGNSKKINCREDQAKKG